MSRASFEHPYAEAVRAADPDGGCLLRVTFVGRAVDAQALCQSLLTECVAYLPGPALSSYGHFHHACRTAIVTGSTSGIGHEIARRLHADGFNIVITGRDLQRGEQVREELGANAVFVALDLTAPGAPAELAAAAIDAYGRLDVVVNNAAMDTGDLLDVPIDAVRHVLEVNSVAAIAVLQESAKRMGHGGAIINISSRLASIGIPTMRIYSAAKGAIKTLTTAAAVELAPRNIRVNAFAPGLTRTPLYDTWMNEQADPARAERDRVADIPLGRLADPATSPPPSASWPLKRPRTSPEPRLRSTADTPPAD